MVLYERLPLLYIYSVYFMCSYNNHHLEEASILQQIGIDL